MRLYNQLFCRFGIILIWIEDTDEILARIVRMGQKDVYCGVVDACRFRIRMLKKVVKRLSADTNVQVARALLPCSLFLAPGVRAA